MVAERPLKPTAVVTVGIVLRFFKAFRANLRLNVVTMTLLNAAEEIFHFFIVFFTIFICFATIAHVLFGNDIAEFSSIVQSLKTSFNTLMGDFGWYTDFSGNELSSEFLPSGIPQLFLLIWFFSYMVFVLLLLMNMLMATWLAFHQS